ncbi:MAG: DUF4388 domain-containing protein [Pseudomonadota bacterium]
MTYKLIRLIDEDEETPAMDGVPIPTGIGVEVESREDRVAAKLLNLINGVKSIRELLDDLPLTPVQLGEVVARLYDLGAVAFEPDYCDKYLVEEKPPGAPGPEPGPVDDMIPEFEDALREAEKARAGAVPAAAGRPEQEEEKPAEMMEEGSLEETPLWQKLIRLERMLFTGRIMTRLEGKKREFYFANGQLHHAVSDYPEEDIGKLLLDKGQLSKDQHASYMQKVSQGKENPLRVLSGMGAFSDHQKLAAQRWVGQTVTFSGLQQEKGTFVIEKMESLPAQVPKLGLNFKGIMTRFMAEVFPIEEEADKLKDKLEYWLVPLSEEMDMDVDEKQQRLWDIIVERPRRLMDLMTLTTMYRRETYKFILTLLTRGMLEMSKRPPFEEGPIDLRRLNDVVEILHENHLFDVLTCHPISDFNDVKRSYDKMIKKFDLSAYPALTEDQKKKLESGRKRVEEAWNMLKEDESRRAYRKETYSEYQLRQYAQLQYQKAEVYLFWKQDPQTALGFFTSSIDLDPHNPLYQAAFAFTVLSMGAPNPKQSEQALHFVNNIANLSTTNPTVLAFVGGALLRIGQRQRAEALFNKASETPQGAAVVSSMVSLIRGEEKG